MTNMFSLEGQVALITGAGQGVGRETALQFAEHGAAGVIVNDFVKERAEEVAAEIRTNGGQAEAYQADVTDAASVAAMVAFAKTRFGGLNILVNNAGNAGPTDDIGALAQFWETDRADWDRWLGTNLFGVLNTCKAAIPLIVEAGGGRLITVISEAGRSGEPHLAVYSGAKAGAAGFTRGIARAVARFNITANNVALGTIETPGVAALLADPAANDRIKKLYPLRSFGQPEDAAAAILYLAAKSGRWITGQTIPVNGGYTFNQ